MTTRWWLACALLGAVVVAGCGLKRRHRCTATTDYLGKPRTGRGDDFDDEKKARELARKDLCPTYCKDEDPDVEAAYLKARDPAKPKDFVERGNVVANPPVRAVVESCTAKCETALTGASFAEKCEYSGI